MKKLLYSLMSLGMILASMLPTATYAILGSDQEALTLDSIYYIRDDEDCPLPGNEAAGSPSNAVPGGDNIEAVWNALIDHHFSTVQTAGIMGNMQTESGFDPLIVQGGGTSTNPASAGSLGYGLVQWTPGSKLIPYLKGQTPSIISEVEALWQQLQGGGGSPEAAAGRAVYAATTIAAATQAFELKYERHAGPPQPRRTTQAQAIYDKAMAEHWKTTAADGAPPSNSVVPGTGLPGADGVTAGACPGGDGTTATTTGGCTNPLGAGHFTNNRTDDGVDYAAAGSPQPLLAVCDMIVLHSQDSPGWGPDGKFIYTKLTSGPFAGKCWYYAEHLDPNDMPANGKVLKAGDHIATLLPGGWNLEVGFARGDRLAATSVGQAGYPSVSGIAAAKFLRSLGAATRDDPGPGPAVYGGGSCPADVQPVK